MEAEASRMVTEKIAAAAEAQAVAAVAAFGGRPAQVVANKALRVVKKRVRANKQGLACVAYHFLGPLVLASGSSLVTSTREQVAVIPTRTSSRAIASLSAAIISDRSGA